MSPDEKPLERSLHAIDEAAARICDGVELADPETIASALERETAGLQDALASLMGGRNALPAPAARDDDPFCALVRGCAQRAIESLDQHVDYIAPAEPPPTPPIDAAVLGTTIERVLHLASDHAGDGGDVCIQPTTSEGDAVLLVRARHPLGESPAIPPEMHFRSLEDFVRALGAKLTWQAAGREVEFRLTLPG